MLKRKAEVFAPTDGVIRVCADSDERQERGADFSDASLLLPMYPLAFRRMRISSRDVELADSTGCELSAKVETRYTPLINANNDVELDGKAYELSRVENRGRTCWLWLSEIATDGTCELLSESYEYDAVGIPHKTRETPILVNVRSLSPSLRRSTANGSDSLAAALTLRLRASDYEGEQHVRRSGRTYTVMSTESHGRWVDLTCRERGADRG
ncbi:MAG: hypothetical protein IKG84_04760 [Bacteroidales bacterium]|nr:hypothetical protein [Bacteroidales bacterium]